MTFKRLKETWLGLSEIIEEMPKCLNNDHSLAALFESKRLTEIKMRQLGYEEEWKKLVNEN